MERARNAENLNESSLTRKSEDRMPSVPVPVQERLQRRARLTALELKQASYGGTRAEVWATDTARAARGDDFAPATHVPLP